MGFDRHNTPGFEDAIESEEIQVFNPSAGNVVPLGRLHKVTIDDESTDAGNTPTTTIRGGHAMALERASGNAYIYDADANDGRQIPIGILHEHTNLLKQGVAAERFSQIPVKGMYKESEMVGDFDMQARTALSPSFIGDKPETNPVAGGMFGIQWLGRWYKTANYTLLTKDHAQLFMAGGAVNFTLPTIANGLCYGFFNATDANMTITGSNNILVFNDLAASSVAFSTTNEKIGGAAIVQAQYVNTTLKWLFWNLSSGNTLTIT